MDVKTLSAMLGHVSAATTLDIYTHITDDMQLTAADTWPSIAESVFTSMPFSNASVANDAHGRSHGNGYGHRRYSHDLLVV